MDKKRTYRLPPCPDYDVEGTESWLEEMAAEGWQLEEDGFFAGFAAFEARPPARLRYRLEAAPKPTGMWSDSDRPAQEAVAYGEALGWSYVATRGQFYIYRCARADAPELNTDPRVQALALDLVRKRERSSLVSLVIWLVLYPLMFSRLHVLLTAIAVGTWRYLWGVGLAVWLVAGSLAGVLHLRRLRKQLARGEPLRHRKDWKKRALRHRLRGPVFLVLLAGWILSMLFRWSDMSALESTLRPEDLDALPFATMADLAGGGTWVREDLYESNASTAISDLLAPVALELNQTGRVVGEDGAVLLDGSLDISYYETASPLLARRILSELQREDQRNWSKEYRELALPDLGVEADAAAAYSAFRPVLLLVDGSRCIRIALLQFGDTPVPLETWAPRAAQIFCAGG